MSTKTIKSNKYKAFALFHVFILQTYALLVTFKGYPVFEIRKNLDLRKILFPPKIFLKSRFHCTVLLFNTVLVLKQKYVVSVLTKNQHCQRKMLYTFCEETKRLAVKNWSSF